MYILSINVDWTIVIVCVMAIFIMAAIGYYTDCNRDMEEESSNKSKDLKKDKETKTTSSKDLPPTYNYEVKSENDATALTILAKDTFETDRDIDAKDDIISAEKKLSKNIPIHNKSLKDDDFESLINEHFFDSVPDDPMDDVMTALEELEKIKPTVQEPSDLSLGDLPNESKEKSSRERLDPDNIFKL